MTATVTNVKFLPLLPSEYTYELSDNSDFFINQVTSKNEFRVWRQKFEVLNKENFTYRQKRLGKQYAWKEWYICHHAERARRSSFEKKGEKQRHNRVEPISG